MKYLDLRVDKNGLRQMKEKEVIIKSPKSKTLTEFKLFLGLIHY